MAATLILEDLQRHRYKHTSQIDEDGVLEYIFQQIGTHPLKIFVEVGIRPNAKEELDGNAIFLRSKGWIGWMMDIYEHPASFGINKQYISPDNVNAVLEAYGCPESFDLFSIDIDSLEYYVLKELLKKFKPRVVVSEYNCVYKDKRVVSRLNDFNWAGDRFGVSGLLLKELMNDNGYVMVHSNRVNAFFVKAAELSQKSIKEFENLQPEFFDLHKVISKEGDWEIYP